MVISSTSAERRWGITGNDRVHSSVTLCPIIPIFRLLSQGARTMGNSFTQLIDDIEDEIQLINEASNN
jgi:hypothetical protein